MPPSNETLTVPCGFLLITADLRDSSVPPAPLQLPEITKHMAQNVSHSPLVQQSAAAPHPSAAAADHAALERELLDARRKFSSSLESNVLDYLHYSPQALEDCVRTMHTLCSNILEHPDDPKYRKIRAVNKAYLRHIAGVNHAEDLMIQAGWRSKVVEMERSWVWDHPQDSHEWRVLQAAVEVLHKALQTLHMKAEHKRKEDEARKSKHADERERIRLALEDDRRQRQVMQQLTASQQQQQQAATATAPSGSSDHHQVSSPRGSI